jgi:hypothetical protein
MRLIFLIALNTLMNVDIHSQTGYRILENHNLHLSETTPCKKEIINKILYLIDNIHRQDQTVRSKSLDIFIKESRRVDSINFIKFYSFFQKNGYFNLGKNEIPLTEREVSNFLVKYYSLHLHFSDRFGLPLTNLILNSIVKKTCNENDLMNYFITFLWRKTEFVNLTYCGIPYHIVLMPNLHKGTYSKYFNHAFTKYIEYCISKDSNFRYFYLDDLRIANGKLNWDKFNIPTPWNRYFKVLVYNTVNFFMENANTIIKNANALVIPDGTYSILYCTHPNIIGNPLYTY